MPGYDGSLDNTSGVTNNAALVYNLSGSQTAAYAISGSGSITKTGSGTLTLTNPNNANSSSAVNIQAGVLVDGFGSGGALPTYGPLNMSGGSLDLEANEAVLTSLTGSGTIGNGATGTANLATLAVTDGGSYSGTIRDGGFGGDAPTTLLMAGGTLILSGTNTFTGGTVVQGGELDITNSAGLADGSKLDRRRRLLFCRPGRGDRVADCRDIDRAGSGAWDAGPAGLGGAGRRRVGGPVKKEVEGWPIMRIVPQRRNSMLAFRWIVAGWLLSLAATSFGASLLTNGGFETPVASPASGQVLSKSSTALTGWTVDSSPGGSITFGALGSSGSLQNGPSASGSQCVELAAGTLPTTAGGIEQTIATISGLQYSVSIDARENTTLAGSNGTLYFGGLAMALTPSSKTTWQTFSETFTASSSSTLLNIVGFSNAGQDQLIVDNVNVTLQPTNSIWVAARRAMQATGGLRPIGIPITWYPVTWGPKSRWAAKRPATARSICASNRTVGIINLASGTGTTIQSASGNALILDNNGAPGRFPARDSLPSIPRCSSIATRR